MLALGARWAWGCGREAALWVAVAMLSTGASACIGEGNVVRVVDGHETQGRFIDPDAYSAYLEGAYEEGRDNPRGALASYRRALSMDPSSIELRVRIASIQCRNGEIDVESAFAPLRSSAPEYAPVWIELANCEVARGKIRESLPHALHAAALAPLQEDVTAMVVRVYELLGRSTDAERWRAGWHLLETRRTNEAPQAPARSPETVRLLAEIDEALDSGALEHSRTLATRARMPAGELAVRAASRGNADEALEQALLVLRANPNDADAWVGAVVAADLVANDELFRQWLARAPTGATPPGELSISIMADLLERRVGTEAAAAWKASAEPR